MKRTVLLLASLVAFLGAYNAKGADTPQAQTFGPFAGLNTNSDPKAIAATQSPDLLNVDIGNNGTSVKKRQGYGLDATLTFSTGPVHNLYKFFDSSGNEVRLAFNDVKVNASVNGAAWSVILTTGITSGATWDCSDYLGFAYCVSSAFDCPIKTNGTTAGTTGVCGTNLVPQGSLISNTGDRLLVGATSANPSRLYYSKSAEVTNFTLGVQPSDSSYEDIVAPGSKLTHLAYRFGKWLWWKDQSFGFIVGTSQFDLNIITVSNSIGTPDNTDVFDGNYVYFRGSDAQIYTYDGAVLSRAISSDISPTLRTANRRKANTWTQSSQAEFQTGTIKPTNQLSTTLSVGDVIVSSFQVNEYSSASGWGSGTKVNFAVGTSSLSLVINNSGNVTNNSFENGVDGGAVTNWTATGSGNIVDSSGYTPDCGLISPKSGSRLVAVVPLDITSAKMNLVDLSGNILVSGDISSNPTCVWTQYTLTSTANIGKRVKLKIEAIRSPSNTSTLTLDDSFILGGSITFWGNKGLQGSGKTYFFDLIENGSSTITSGSFTSQKYDTGFTSSTYQISAINYTVSTSTPTFSLLTASNSTTGPWTQLLTSTGTNSVGHRYAQFVSSISVGSTNDALTYISSFTIVSRSTGTYYSAVNNASSLTSFSTLGITDSVVGGSTITYYVRASSGSFTVLSSTPNWVLQAKNATVNYSSGTYMQLRADFAVTAATEAPYMSDFTFNWVEGSAADKMYGTYFNNAIWFSLSLGTSTTTNNRIFRYDLLANVWTLYDIASNGFLTYNNNLYFGDPTAGKVYQFGNSVYSDNGTAITSYWKSKPMFGDSPFTEKDLKMGSWYIAYSSGTSLTVTYTLDESTNTVTKTINLYDSRKGLIRNNYNFPAGTAPTVFSAKVGDVSSNPPWEVFGGVVTFVPRPIIVTP